MTMPPRNLPAQSTVLRELSLLRALATYPVRGRETIADLLTPPRKRATKKAR